jgi:hypothetical protein
MIVNPFPDCLHPLPTAIRAIEGLSCYSAVREALDQFRLTFNSVKNRFAFKGLATLAAAIERYEFGEYVRLGLWFCRLDDAAPAARHLRYSIVGEWPASANGLADAIREELSSCGLPRYRD